MSRPLLACLLLALSTPRVASLPAALAAQDVHGGEPCPARKSFSGELHCMQIPVFEDRERQAGRELMLHVVILPALGDDVEPDPVFVLPGGPGQAAAGLSGYISDYLAEVRKHRELVLVDYRGTGSSNGLDFELGAEDLLSLVSDPFPRELVQRELAKLRERADLSLYTTDAIVDDLDEVREVLGYDEINLWGGSYGTRVALVFLRRHGEHVRTAVVKSVAPLGFPVGRDFAVDAQRSLERTFAACAADPECSGAYGDLAGKLDRLLARLAEEPVVVPARNPSTGETVDVPLSPAAIALTIRTMLYTMPEHAELPRLLARGAEGDLQEWADRTLATRVLQYEQIAEGLFLSVLAAEDWPLLDPDEIREKSRGTFLGERFSETLTGAVEGWPRAEIDPSFWEPVRSEVPVLLVSGAFDPVTPVSQGAEAARHLPNSLHLVFESGSHDDSACRPCLDGVFAAFIESGTLEGLDTSCAKAERPLRFTVDR